MGIQTEISIGNFPVLPNTAEKSLKKKINMLEIISPQTNVYIDKYEINSIGIKIGSMYHGKPGGANKAK